MSLKWVALLVAIVGIAVFSVQFLLAAEQYAGVELASSEGILEQIVPTVSLRRGEVQTRLPSTPTPVPQLPIVDTDIIPNPYPVRLKGLGVGRFYCSRSSTELTVLGQVFDQRGTVPSVTASMKIETTDRPPLLLLEMPIKNFGHVKGTRDFRRYLSAEENGISAVLRHSGSVTCTLNLQAEGRDLGGVKVLVRDID